MTSCSMDDTFSPVVSATSKQRSTKNAASWLTNAESSRPSSLATASATACASRTAASARRRHGTASATHLFRTCSSAVSALIPAFTKSFSQILSCMLKPPLCSVDAPNASASVAIVPALPSSPPSPCRRSSSEPLARCDERSFAPLLRHPGPSLYPSPNFQPSCRDVFLLPTLPPKRCRPRQHGRRRRAEPSAPRESPRHCKLWPSPSPPQAPRRSPPRPRGRSAG
mmetsp:Transcript_11090/g.33717  ORF Transcript_11090/g.33717 Transcript_11090/m.33717 type:complete len:226 (+) Transcript_11090:264-941(+)